MSLLHITCTCTVRLMNPWASPWDDPPPAAVEPIEPISTGAIVAPAVVSDDPWAEPGASAPPPEDAASSAWMPSSPPPRAASPAPESVPVSWEASAPEEEPKVPMSTLDAMPSVLEDPWSGGVVVLPTGGGVSDEIERHRAASEARHMGIDPESNDSAKDEERKDATGPADTPTDTADESADAPADTEAPSAPDAASSQNEPQPTPESAEAPAQSTLASRIGSTFTWRRRTVESEPQGWKRTTSKQTIASEKIASIFRRTGTPTSGTPEPRESLEEQMRTTSLSADDLSWLDSAVTKKGPAREPDHSPLPSVPQVPRAEFRDDIFDSGVRTGPHVEQGGGERYVGVRDNDIFGPFAEPPRQVFRDEPLAALEDLTPRPLPYPTRNPALTNPHAREGASKSVPQLRLSATTHTPRMPPPPLIPPPPPRAPPRSRPAAPANPPGARAPAPARPAPARAPAPAPASAPRSAVAMPAQPRTADGGLSNADLDFFESM